jgi:hypothetical protein
VQNRRPTLFFSFDANFSAHRPAIEARDLATFAHHCMRIPKPKYCFPGKAAVAMREATRDLGLTPGNAGASRRNRTFRIRHLMLASKLTAVDLTWVWGRELTYTYRWWSSYTKFQNPSSSSLEFPQDPLQRGNPNICFYETVHFYNIQRHIN